MDNKDKIILDLCGNTGAWSKDYRNAGYDVRVITLPEYDVRTYKPPGNVYGILAAPTCTQFSLAAGKKMEDRDTGEGMIVVRACLEIIWECKPVFWAMENPVGYLRRFMGLPAFTFRQWDFKDPGIKPTDLWGYFNKPRKTVKIRPHKKDLLYISAGGSKGRNTREKGVDYTSALIASKTPHRFATAFFKANK